MCRRLASLTYAYHARAMFDAASVRMIVTFQAAQSNKFAWELLVGAISRSH